MITNPQQKTGLNCPVCGAFIPTTITELITAGSLLCPYCGLRLNIDREASHRALDALRKVNDAQRLVDEKSKFKR